MFKCDCEGDMKDDFDYYFLSDPRELTVYDSLVWSSNFGHTIQDRKSVV